MLKSGFGPRRDNSRERPARMSVGSLRRLALLIACLATAPALAQRGAMTVPRNLDQLVDRSAVIIRGSVVSAQVEKHPQFRNLDTVLVTLRVRETLKGDATGQYAFRQYIWDARDRLDAAGYRKGQEMLLLLLAPNRHGLSSPAGLDQGRFRITHDRSGRELAMNGRANLRLFEGLQEESAKEGIALSAPQKSLLAKHRSGPIEARELYALIRTLAQSN
jgi:hypothetical protein